MSLRSSLSPRARQWALRFSVVAGVAVGCVSPRVRTETPEPRLCSEHPDYCRPCEGGECEAPRKSGWICCPSQGGNCLAVKTAAECTSSVVGWCDNYTEDAAGVATCHDK